TPSTAAIEPPAGLDGLYRDMTTDAILRVITKADGVHLSLRKDGNGPLLTPVTEERFKLGRLNEVRFGKDALRLINTHKPEALYTRVAESDPPGARLAEYAGTYWSDEAAAAYVVSVDGSKLSVRITPAQITKLEPTYADGFMTDGGTLIRFTRNARGAVDGADVKA